MTDVVINTVSPDGSGVRCNVTVAAVAAQQLPQLAGFVADVRADAAAADAQLWPHAATPPGAQGTGGAEWAGLQRNS